jgi:hypothetical protein
MSYPEDQFDPSVMRAGAMRQPLQDMGSGAKATMKPPCYLAVTTREIESGLCELEKGLAALKEQLAPILDMREQPATNTGADDTGANEVPVKAIQAYDSPNPMMPVSRLDETMADILRSTQNLNLILNRLRHKIQL